MLGSCIGWLESIAQQLGAAANNGWLLRSALNHPLLARPCCSCAAEERFFQKLEAEVDKCGRFTARLVAELRERLKQLQVCCCWYWKACLQSLLRQVHLRQVHVHCWHWKGAAEAAAGALLASCPSEAGIRT